MLEDEELTNVIVLGGWTKDLTRFIIKNHRALEKKQIKRFIMILDKIAKEGPDEYQVPLQKCLNTILKYLTIEAK